MQNIFHLLDTYVGQRGPSLDLNADQDKVLHSNAVENPEAFLAPRRGSETTTPNFHWYHNISMTQNKHDVS